jgi:hypothetical protein
MRGVQGFDLIQRLVFGEQIEEGAGVAAGNLTAKGTSLLRKHCAQDASELAPWAKGVVSQLHLGIWSQRFFSGHWLALK